MLQNFCFVRQTWVWSVLTDVFWQVFMLGVICLLKIRAGIESGDAGYMKKLSTILQRTFPKIVPGVYQFIENRSFKQMFQNLSKLSSIARF